MRASGGVSDDAGSVSVFTIGWIVVVLMALAVLVGATQVHVDRMRLAAYADELALAAAADVADAGYFARGGDLTDAQVRDAAAERLTAPDARPWVTEVELTDASGGASGAVSVTVAREVTPLWGSWAWLPGAVVTIHAQGGTRIG
ncbi:pilus assembly protein TadG-related protein [Demequina sp.]|uniref:pilus assembly protein TadG-related protein n=1 Tax=Demequina sp. TaxID=2050685 RepID=UPI003A871B25